MCRPPPGVNPRGSRPPSSRVKAPQKYPVRLPTYVRDAVEPEVRGVFPKDAQRSDHNRNNSPFRPPEGPQYI